MIGGHTTTAGAGMAFPDWPLSHGSLNPDQWWTDFMQRLEHGHRMAAESVALFIGVLCAWVWKNKWSVPIAFAGSAILASGARLTHASAPTIAHVGLWSAVVIFTLLILFRSPRPPLPLRREQALARSIALAAFAGVCMQALMGGLRVTTETAGESSAAITFRILHGCFAQLELCLVVVLATLLSPRWLRAETDRELPGRLNALAWAASGVVYLQLVIGAAMRHNGAGLAIPTFPRANAGGGWLPSVHSALIDLNFGHTRVGALLVTVTILALVFASFRVARGMTFLTRPAALLALCLVLQVVLGIFVVWQSRPPILTTMHVLNGAALLATSVLLAMRITRSSGLRGVARAETFADRFEEAHA